VEQRSARPYGHGGAVNLAGRSAVVGAEGMQDYAASITVVQVAFLSGDILSLSARTAVGLPRCSTITARLLTN